MVDPLGGVLDFDGLPDGVVLADADARVVAANSSARRLLELNGAEPLGRHLSDVLALQNLDGDDWFGQVQPYGGLAIRTRMQEASWHTPSGTEVLVTGRLHRDRPGGKVVSTAWSIRDARSRQRVDRERSDLVATVAHELRSPLTGVKGFTATLLSKWDRFTESQKQLMLRTVDADADRLTRLIGELLDVARIDTGRLSVRKEPVDLVEAVSGQLEPISISSGRIISFVSHGRPRVWVDKDKLAQIVANLVENAIKHGDGDVTVTVAAVEGGGADVMVDDAGDGINPEIRPRIFTKFWKHGSTGGSGLGLYIVGGLIEAHEGQVRVEDSPAGGARMLVRLPHGQPASVD
jgi:signal transduction histidine kinase